MVRIKKQYKQPDGTLIEVEGSEAEIEAFEKKQQKQKISNEQNEKKRTVLYGRDALEEFRKIVREEIAAQPPRVEYRYLPYNPNPYWFNPWVQPLIPVPQITWTIGQNTSEITCSPPDNKWYASNGNLASDSCVSVFNSSAAPLRISSNDISVDAVKELKSSYSGVVSGWSGRVSAGSQNYLMSPRM